MATVISSSPPKETGFLERKRIDKFNSTEGTLFVSKPYRSKDSRKLRALITFTPRKSVFDTTNETSGVNEFRGFYTLFWVSIFIWTVRTYINSIEAYGVPLNLDFAMTFSQDAVTLAISDFFLVMSTGFCVPFAKALSRGWIPYYWVGLTLQHILQTTILFTTITWTFNRKWPWVQSGFLTLHSLVMVMKMHSYLTFNGHLQYTSQQSRLNSRDTTYSATISSSITEVKETIQPPQHPLVSHPDPSISALAKEYSDLQAELVSLGPERVSWPNNITWKNFAVYQLIPTLIYELEYPRTKQIRPLYIVEKTIATFGTFVLLYTVTETFILPLTPTSEQSFFRSLLDLALPFMMAYVLLFYIIFECICNGFAELSYFADRQFYEDWSRWNSTSWDEFSRKWNKPVHGFLLRHVYAPLIYSCGFSKTVAMLFTFFLSASAHELVMVVVTQKIRLYLLVMQLVQIPLILLSRHPIIKRNKLMGNVVFWLGLYAGFPLLCVAYVAY
ncbi:putative sterol O-acyltransferase 1 [Leucoagaricus sp. SymC.cos]|nr:putative sterol O-acyltransferase 1 [Leucoagaricus sp. SymC.cos]